MVNVNSKRMILVDVMIIVVWRLNVYLHHSNQFFLGSTDSSSEAAKQSSPNYIFVSNNSQSCPPLVGERLLTTMRHGQSFEGLVVNLACRGDYNPFPNQIKCRRRQAFGEACDLEWSHIPVCYPSVLVSKTHWAKTLHARSVSCKFLIFYIKLQ